MQGIWSNYRVFWAAWSAGNGETVAPAIDDCGGLELELRLWRRRLQLTPRRTANKWARAYERRQTQPQNGNVMKADAVV